MLQAIQRFPLQSRHKKSKTLGISSTLGKSHILRETLSNQCPDYDEYSKMDVLPSYELHNFLFDRTLNDETSPPKYGSESHFTIPENFTPGIIFPKYHKIYPQNRLLENVEKLHDIDLPVDVKIVLTKDNTATKQPLEAHDSFKQYYPGEMLFGYITIENKANFDIPFEMMLISMEGEMGTTNSYSQRSVNKKILSVYDFEASYHYHHIQCGNQNECSDVCLDDSSFSPGKRILSAGVAITRFFKFKIPEMLLEDQSPEKYLEQLKLPPSTGCKHSSKQSVADGVGPLPGYSTYEKASFPIILNDYGVAGAYCNYFVNFQLIAQRLDIFDCFYHPDQAKGYSFLSIKSKQRFFRIGRTAEEEKVSNYYLSTFAYLDCVTTCIEQIEKLLLPEEISAFDDSLRPKNDANIMNICRRPKIFKHLNLSAECFNEKALQTSFHKSFFSKLDGILLTNLKMKKNSVCETIQPAVIKYLKFKSLINHVETKGPFLEVELQFIPSGEIKKGIQLPDKLNIAPKLKMINIQSVEPIPLIIDENFIFQDYFNVISYLNELRNHYMDIIKYSKQLRKIVPRETISLIKRMALLEYRELDIADIFRNQTIDLHDKWKFDVESRTYKCSFKTKIDYNLDHFLKNQVTLGSSFQSCMITRLYKIEFDIATKKNCIHKVSFPVTFI